MTTSAAAPSLIEDAFAAVTGPLLAKCGAQQADFVAV
jgi:hypothetical protein